MILLDTNVVSEPMRQRPDPRVLDRLDAQAMDTLNLATISLSELLLGIESLPPGKRRNAVTAALGRQIAGLFESRIVPFDIAAAEAYGKLVIRARGKGYAISIADAQIAAIAQPGISRSHPATTRRSARRASRWSIPGIRLPEFSPAFRLPEPAAGVKVARAGSDGERMMSEGRRARPVPTPETLHFWEGTRLGELRLQRCNQCGKAYFPPRPFCPHCASRDVAVFRASGKGRLYSYVIHHRPVPGLTPPYAIAVVELDEGPRLMTNMTGCPQTPEALQLDMPVEVAFEPLDDEITLPLFRPAAR
jgi:uncharacterized protein